jgi:hypothetical protein
MTDAFTSDSKARSNIVAFAIDMPKVPYSIGLSARVGVLNDLGTVINSNGGSIDVLDRSAAYDQSSVTQRINDISRALNTMGVSPSLPIYSSTDYNSFSSIITIIVAGMAGIPL